MELKEPEKEGDERLWEPGGLRTPEEHGSQNQLFEQGSQKLTEFEESITEPQWDMLGSL